MLKIKQFLSLFLCLLMLTSELPALSLGVPESNLSATQTSLTNNKNQSQEAIMREVIDYGRSVMSETAFFDPTVAAAVVIDGQIYFKDYNRKYDQLHGEVLTIIGALEKMIRRREYIKPLTIEEEQDVLRRLGKIRELSLSYKSEKKLKEEFRMAEQELIKLQKMLGHPLKGKSIYITYRPCNKCSDILNPIGFKEIVYASSKINKTFQTEESLKKRGLNLVFTPSLEEEAEILVRNYRFISKSKRIQHGEQVIRRGAQKTMRWLARGIIKVAMANYISTKNFPNYSNQELSLVRQKVWSNNIRFYTNPGTLLEVDNYYIIFRGLRRDDLKNIESYQFHSIKYRIENLIQYVLGVESGKTITNHELARQLAERIKQKKINKKNKQLFIFNGKSASGKTRTGDVVQEALAEEGIEMPHLKAGLAFRYFVQYLMHSNVRPDPTDSIEYDKAIRTFMESYEIRVENNEPVFYEKGEAKKNTLVSGAYLSQDQVYLYLDAFENLRKDIDLFIHREVSKLMKELKYGMIISGRDVAIDKDKLSATESVYRFWIERSRKDREQYRLEQNGYSTDQLITIHDDKDNQSLGHNVLISLESENWQEEILGKFLKRAIAKLDTVAGSGGFFYTNDTSKSNLSVTQKKGEMKLDTDNRIVNQPDEEKRKTIKELIENPKVRVVNLVIAGGGGDVKSTLIMANRLQKIFQNQIDMGFREHQVKINVIDSSLKRASENPNGGPVELKDLYYLEKGEYKPLEKIKDKDGRELNFAKITRDFYAKVHIKGEKGDALYVAGKPVFKYVPISVGAVSNTINKWKNNIHLYMLDSTLPGKEIAEELIKLGEKEAFEMAGEGEEAGDYLNIGVDVGGDILTTGYETGVRSPATDATILDAMAELNAPIFLAGTGADGEIVQDLHSILLGYLMRNQIAGFWNLLGDFHQMGKDAYAQLLEDTEPIRTETSNVYLNAIRELIEKKVNYVEHVGPYDRYLFTSMMKEVEIRGGTRLAAMPKSAVGVTMFWAKDIVDQIKIEGLKRAEDSWNEKELAFRNSGPKHVTEMTDPNNFMARTKEKIRLIEEYFLSLEIELGKEKLKRQLLKLLKEVLEEGQNALYSQSGDQGNLFLYFGAIRAYKALIGDDARGNDQKVLNNIGEILALTLSREFQYNSSHDASPLMKYLKRSDLSKNKAELLPMQYPFIIGEFFDLLTELDHVVSGNYLPVDKDKKYYSFGMQFTERLKSLTNKNFEGKDMLLYISYIGEKIRANQDQNNRKVTALLYSKSA